VTHEFHPLANIFPLMEGSEFSSLVSDVKKHGLNEPVVLCENKILDGRNRYRACQEAGIKVRFRAYEGDDPVAYVITANIHRRHLTANQKRDLIAKLLKANPEKSDRAIAKTAKVSDKTVGRERRKLESTAEVPQLGKTVGADGKPRKRPVREAKVKPLVSPAPKPAVPPPLPLVPSPKSALAEPNESDRCEHLRAQKDELFERFHDFAEELDQDAAQRLRGLVNQADAIFEQVLAVWQPERREQEALPSAPMPNNEPPTDVKNDNEDDPFAFPPSLKREPPADLNAELGRLNAKAKNAARSN
jgi:hypothetical protein